ncbi:MAG: hypothetical protein BZY79_04375 [SAR202 cluster bacterium Casp-Chloro-G4]|nr:LLM class flavin-dependent oxidoreductase [Chloroflexota bacterium]MDA1227811.1 LLM class flavin-dependent oxidoreductase [Chloroflexota bacterium]PKB61313.1 MAG: hypothetical protein BZY79_04375 [SAR202 cluster bacterium Casp-Chloro-G4]
MRFGSFVFPVSHSPDNDSNVIDNTLAEVELGEEIGLDTAWLAEHHFDGAAAYADPLMFGAAVAARTKRIKIGFAVLEMAFYHPVRLAVQTSVLDNLSHGRLIVGIGRGSAFNHYEYIGFGMTMEQGVERLGEAEDLLIKAWTTENLKYDGKFWKVAFPLLRPRPFQKPHPPIVRACISEASTIAMGKIGRPVLIGEVGVPAVRNRVDAFENAMLASGFSEVATEKALDQCWFSRDIFVAETYAEAREKAEYGFGRERKHFRAARENFNPDGFPPIDPNKPLSPGEDIEQAFIMGTPQQVVDQVAEMRDAGTRNLMLKFNIGEMAPEDVQKSMKLFGEKVIPLFKS